MQDPKITDESNITPRFWSKQLSGWWDQDAECLLGLWGNGWSFGEKEKFSFGLIKFFVFVFCFFEKKRQSERGRGRERGRERIPSRLRAVST